MSNSIGIIGVGSSFGADSVASIVIEKCQQELNNCALKNPVHIEYYDRPGLYLLEIIKSLTTVHLIDAVISDKPAGYIHHYDDLNILAEQNQLLSCHGFGIAEVLRLGKSLNCLPKNIIIHGIEITKTMKNDPFPKSVIKACGNLADCLIRKLNS